MQDHSGSMETAEPERSDQSSSSDSPVIDDPKPNSDSGSSTVSTVVAEVLPGIAVVFGEVPADLKLDLISFGLVSTGDLQHISVALASIGSTATVAGNLGNAFASLQGLYRVDAATQALLKAGGTLAIKDGAKLGTVLTRGGGLAQARFIPVASVSAAQTAAALGPALSMIALQMQLSEVTGLVQTNIALTRQTLTTIRYEQWAELTALVATIGRAIEKAEELGTVPSSLWDSVAGCETSLRKQRDLYRRNVANHVLQIRELGTRARREYLQANADAVFFDVHALLSSLKAWTGYQALHASRARAAGPADDAEARLVDLIARDTRKELAPALADTKSLVGSLTRELRVIAELPGQDSLPLTARRRDSNATRQASARLLEAIKPLADVLLPAVVPLEAPGVVCAPKLLKLEPYLRILKWYLEEGEILRAFAVPDQLDVLGPGGAMLEGARERLAAVRDKAAAKTLVAVTDRRVLMARTNPFLEQGEIRQVVPIDQVRYVRVGTSQDGNGDLAVDLITRDENMRWLFHTHVHGGHVDALAAVLAESMRIPDAERDALERRRYEPIAARRNGVLSAATETTSPHVTASDGE